MTKPVNTPEFWQRRFVDYMGDPRRVLWTGTDAQWDQMEQDHKEILAKEIKPDDKLLDAGCGYGRLLDLLPSSFRGGYTGVDISPKMIAEAKRLHPGHDFRVCDLSNLPVFTWTRRYVDGRPHDAPIFDVAVCIMLRHMLTAHVSPAYWDIVEGQLKQVAKRLLILEPREVL